MARTQRGTTKKGPTAAVVKNKMSKPAMRFAYFRADSGERMAVAGANMKEKMAFARASMRSTFTRMRYIVHPVRRVAAKEAAQESKLAATERRKQAVARARTVSSQKKAVIRERRAANLTSSV